MKTNQDYKRFKRHTHGVYVISNIANGKKYIGGTTCLKTRLVGHICGLLYGRHSNKSMQSDFNKYGVDAFKLEITRVRKTRSWIRSLKWETIRKEYELIRKLNPAYNTKIKKLKLANLL